MNDTISNGILKFFDAIREHYNCKNKDIILGIVLPWNSDIIKYGKWSYVYNLQMIFTIQTLEY